MFLSIGNGSSFQIHKEMPGFQEKPTNSEINDAEHFFI